MATIGNLWGGNMSDVSRFREAFQLRLRDLDKERDIAFADRYAEGYANRLPGLATDLVSGNVNVIVASATPAARAARDATRGKDIAVVFAAVGEPSLVAATNVTGVRLLEPESSRERLNILREVIPNLKTVAALWNEANPVHTTYLEQMGGVKDFKVQDPNDLDRALDAIRQQRPEALVVLPDLMFHSQRSRIITFAATNRLPAIYSQRSYVEEGGLMSYGPNYTDMFRQAAVLVNSILNAPERIPPIEEVKSSELVINRSTANALGVKIPPRAVVIG